VAVSAGICEEVVFRGWLLFAPHNNLALNGTALLVLAAVIFGLAHVYQGIAGILATTRAGAFFCILYVATGTLPSQSYFAGWSTCASQSSRVTRHCLYRWLPTRKSCAPEKR
jgi:membrane protease YdiL (CAAX protease family)